MGETSNICKAVSPADLGVMLAMLLGESHLFGTRREAAGGQNSIALAWLQKNSKTWGPEMTVVLSTGSNLPG